MVVATINQPLAKPGQDLESAKNAIESVCTLRRSRWSLPSSFLIHTSDGPRPTKCYPGEDPDGALSLGKIPM